MAFVVEMSRGTPYEEGFSSWSCGEAAWVDLLSIAQAFGWIPGGTFTDPLAARNSADYAKFFNPNYEVQEWQYCKRFSDRDAQNLATALYKASSAIHNGNIAIFEKHRPFLIRDDVCANELTHMNKQASKIIEEFAKFASGGGFAFAWDD